MPRYPVCKKCGPEHTIRRLYYQRPVEEFTDSGRQKYRWTPTPHAMCPNCGRLYHDEKED